MYLKNLIFYFYFTYMGGFGCMYAVVSYVCAVLVRPGAGHWVPWVTVRDGCEPLSVCWDRNPGLL